MTFRTCCSYTFSIISSVLADFCSASPLADFYSASPLADFSSALADFFDIFIDLNRFMVIVIVILIVNSKLLKRHSEAKRRAPAYSRALRQIRGVFQRIVRGRFRSGCQRVRGCVKSEGFSKE